MNKNLQKTPQKIGTEKQEMKYEPQTNGKTQIRQIKAKSKEFIQTHKHKENKVKESDPESKGNQKLYQPIKRKLTKCKLENKPKQNANWGIKQRKKTN